MIKIMNLKDTKPSEPYDFYIDRRTSVGNKFAITKTHDRDYVCDRYKAWFASQVESPFTAVYLIMRTFLEVYRKYGKLRLFCWCAPKRCHGQTIKKWLEKNL